MKICSQKQFDVTRPASEQHPAHSSFDIGATTKSSCQPHPDSSLLWRLRGSLSRAIRSPIARMSGQAVGVASLLGLSLTGRTEAITVLILAGAIAYKRVILAQAEAYEKRKTADADAAKKDAEAYDKRRAADADAAGKEAGAYRERREADSRVEMIRAQSARQDQLLAAAIEGLPCKGEVSMDEGSVSGIIKQAHSGRRRTTTPENQPPRLRLYTG
jgi:hypothetical protein